MGINTIMRHLERAKTELCFRTLENLRNQGVSVEELRAQCQKRGWFCIERPDRISIAKTEAARARALIKDAVSSQHYDPNELPESELVAVTKEPMPLADSSSFPERLSLLHASHVRPLTEFREALLTGLPAGTFVPNFDPLDGGIHAEVLLLLETPGRVPRDTQFTSLDNPSVTSKNLRELVQEAGLQRRRLLMWNLVPWDIGSETRIQATRRSHHALGVPALLQLVELLSSLRAIVFFGGKSQTAIPEMEAARPDLKLIRSPHPSGQVLNTRPEMRAEMLRALRSAAGVQ
jgi:uracil-DNA glycosylase